MISFRVRGAEERGDSKTALFSSVVEGVGEITVFIKGEK
jgi:hypothetical protein